MVSIETASIEALVSLVCRDSKRLAILWYVSESVEDVQVVLGRVSSYSVSLLF